MKPKTFIVKGTIYPFDTIVSVGGDPKEAAKALIDMWISEEDANDACPEWTTQGRTVMFLDTNVTIIRLKHPPKCPVSIAHLSHEVCHATQFLFSKIGMWYWEDSYEAFAYYTGYLTEKIISKFLK